MADEDGSKPKYEVEEISIKTRVQKILDLSTTRSDLSISLSYCKNRTKQFHYLTENTFCSQQSILLRSTSCTFCTLYDRILFRLNKKTSYTLYRLETSDDLQVALGRIPQYKIKPEKVLHTMKTSHVHIFILLFHFSPHTAPRCC